MKIDKNNINYFISVALLFGAVGVFCIVLYRYRKYFSGSTKW